MILKYFRLRASGKNSQMGRTRSAGRRLRITGLCHSEITEPLGKDREINLISRYSPTPRRACRDYRVPEEIN